MKHIKKKTRNKQAIETPFEGGGPNSGLNKDFKALIYIYSKN